VEVYIALGLGLVIGYAVARWIIRHDPTGRGGRTERGFAAALVAITILVIVVMFAEVQLPAGLLRTSLRGVTIFACSAVLTAAVSSFLMYAKNDASRGRWN
jgi:hypothetical protein